MLKGSTLADLVAENGVEKNKRRTSRHLAKAALIMATEVAIVDVDAVAAVVSEAGDMEMASLEEDSEVSTAMLRLLGSDVATHDIAT